MQDGDIVTLVVLFIVIAFISLVAWAVPVRVNVGRRLAGPGVGMEDRIGMR